MLQPSLSITGVKFTLLGTYLIGPNMVLLPQGKVQQSPAGVVFCPYSANINQQGVWNMSQELWSFTQQVCVQAVQVDLFLL